MIFFKHPKVIPKLNISVNDNQMDQVNEFNFLVLQLIKALYGSLISERYL